MKKKCILFIHGITGDRETWKDLEPIIKDRIYSNKYYSNVQDEYFIYDSSLFASLGGLGKKVLKRIISYNDNNPKSVLGKIHSLSKRLKSYIDEKLQNYSEIIIVAHSMGGLIATRYILDEIKNKKLLKIKKALYICTPFLGSYFGDVAKITKIASDEGSEMSTNSTFLKDLHFDIDKYNLSEKLEFLYYFGDNDEIIIDYRKIIKNDDQITLKGNHTSILKYPNIQENFSFIETFIIKKTYNTFIEKIFSRAILDEQLIHNTDYTRKIKDTNIRDKISLNPIEEIYFEDTDKDKEVYFTMYNSIRTNSYNPHVTYQAEKYFFSIISNETNLENYWHTIKMNNMVKPYLYVGSRGTGKTILQNIWINKHFNDMEINNIFHVRCDVHKIYDILETHAKESSPFKKKITIKQYLDIQLLYIFLKYRNKKYNNKGDGGKGAESNLMKKIDDLLDKKNTKIVANSKFSTLGDFIDTQSNNIKHSEINLRPNDRNYSYAIELMKNLKNNLDSTIKDIANLIITHSSKFIECKTLRQYEKLKEFNMLHKFLETFDDSERRSKYKEIKKSLQANKENVNTSKLLLIEGLLTQFYHDKTNSIRTTTELWLNVSEEIQKILLYNNFKILKIVDGIDNIIIHDNENTKIFFEHKLEEIYDIIYNNQREREFYFFALRNDTLELLKEIAANTNKQKEERDGYKLENSENQAVYRVAHHDSAHTVIDDIKKKRCEVLLSLIPKHNSLFVKILNKVFTYSDNKIILNKNITNTRALLRNDLFLALQVYYEFRKRELTYNDQKCIDYIHKKLIETLFLRNKLYVETKASVLGVAEDTGKIFPNIFYIHSNENSWSGLCRIRILQLLSKNSYEKNDLINKLKLLYSENYIDKKIKSLVNYNLIETIFDKSTQKIIYKNTEKSNYLLKIISQNTDIIYHLSLDTPLPKFYAHNNFEAYIKNTKNPKNTGYSNSIIKNVISFILFIKYIHNSEIRILKQKYSENEIKVFIMPINLESIEKRLKYLYMEHIKDFNKLHSYFKDIGNYDTLENLEKDLLNYGWTQK